MVNKSNPIQCSRKRKWPKKKQLDCHCVQKNDQIIEIKWENQQQQIIQLSRMQFNWNKKSKIRGRFGMLFSRKQKHNFNEEVKKSQPIWRKKNELQWSFKHIEIILPIYFPTKNVVCVCVWMVFFSRKCLIVHIDYIPLDVCSSLSSGCRLMAVPASFGSTASSKIWNEFNSI